MGVSANINKGISLKIANTSVYLQLQSVVCNPTNHSSQDTPHIWTSLKVVNKLDTLRQKAFYFTARLNILKVCECVRACVHAFSLCVNKFQNCIDN